MKIDKKNNKVNKQTNKNNNNKKQIDNGLPIVKKVASSSSLIYLDGDTTSDIGPDDFIDTSVKP
eukprot:UN05481